MSGFFLNTFIGPSIFLYNCLAQAILPDIGGKFLAISGSVLFFWYCLRTDSKSRPYSAKTFMYFSFKSKAGPLIFSNFTSNSNALEVCNYKENTCKTSTLKSNLRFIL